MIFRTVSFMHYLRERVCVCVCACLVSLVPIALIVAHSFAVDAITLSLPLLPSTPLPSLLFLLLWPIIHMDASHPSGCRCHCKLSAQ